MPRSSTSKCRSSRTALRVQAENHGVWQHALRALALTRRRTIAGTALAAYGPRRLERCAAAGRPGDAREHVQRLDSDAAPPDLDHARRRAAAHRPQARRAAARTPGGGGAPRFPAPVARGRCARRLRAVRQEHDRARHAPRATCCTRADDHHRRALQRTGDDPRDPRRPVRHHADAPSPAPHRRAPERPPTARACSTGRSRTTAACSSIFSAPRAPRSSGARSA